MLRFLMLLPRQYADMRTFNLALGVCTANGDLKSADLVLEMMADRQLQVDIKHRTQLIMGEQASKLDPVIGIAASFNSRA